MSDIEKILTRGLQANLPVSLTDGILRFTTDTKRLYLDTSTARLLISDVISDYTEAQLNALSSHIAGKVYVAKDTFRVYVSDGTSLLDASRIIPVAVSDNNEYYVWTNNGGVGGPKYNTGFSYNPYTKTLKAGGLSISQTEEQVDGSTVKVVHFNVL
ncbi:MAG: hypothetical protein IKR19_08500 [Acholeplasmatales bacterium]|nr:hypothetical protein [Acholeplasmatales bacterium]